jgi:ATP-dependent phosphofructokinase / diphosphate-dependent phosphofructokinase
MRIGLFTGGGDCPGLNASIRAVVRKAIEAYDDQLLGFRDGRLGGIGYALERKIEERSGGDRRRARG